MAKVMVRTSQEYMEAHNNKELSNKQQCEIQYYISELKCAEAMPIGSGRTRKINKNAQELNILLGFEEAPKVETPKTEAKVYNYLCFHYGENAPTAKSPKRLFVEGQDEPLLDIIVQKCANWDFDMLVDCNLWEKRAVTIPGWMDPNDYPNEDIALRWFLGFGGNIDWPETWYRKLCGMDEKTRFATIKLLNQKSFRAPKRQEIRDRIVSWLNGTGNVNRYDFVNIRNEFVDRECESVSHHLYWSR